ncbi:MAG: hypothetical protein HRU11_06555 [Parvularculaceae bacterium]|nr:hypothetical protein [Parvularculaceae bacterium]
MKFLKSLAAAAATMFVASNAHAITLVDTATTTAAGPEVGGIAAVDLFLDEVFFDTFVGVVGGGYDIDLLGVAAFDVNAGTDGDLITFDSFSDFGGGIGGGTFVDFLFTLPLTAGQTIESVSIVSSQLAGGFTVLLDSNVFVALFDDGPITAGNVFTLEVVYADAAVPVPAAALLFAPAAFFAARRRKAKAA